MKKKEKAIFAIVSGIVALVVLFIVYVYCDTREKITDINKYEEYLGNNGKYKENYGTYNDIFPDEISENAQVEDFCYYYYNPWDACYLGYLVYTCDAKSFEKEYARLRDIPSSENKYIYGTTAFPYELCAVYADEYYGYIYALADRASNKFIYVELQFANGFTDIKYKEYIAAEYLPIGFQAEMKKH